MLIFHIAEAARWEAATLAGSYARSTRGRTLEQEGFIHACRGEQLEEIHRRWYADATEPLVLLVIDTARLASPWSEDPVEGSTFPHIHGPLNPGAVVGVLPLAGAVPAAAPVAAAGATAPSAATTSGGSRPPEGSMATAFLGEMLFRMGMAVMVMLLAIAGSVVAKQLGVEPIAGVVLGFVVGVPLALAVSRRRNRRLTAA